MNIVFYLLVLIAAMIVWVFGAFLFVPLGKYIYRIIKDVTEQIKRDN